MDVPKFFFIYVLECESGKYYVGKTDDLFRRLFEHWNGEGAEWTKLHKPIKVERVIETTSNFDEDRYTKEYMAKKGIYHVRGAAYTKIQLDVLQIDLLVTELHSGTDCCLKCGAKTQGFYQILLT